MYAQPSFDGAPVLIKRLLKSFGPEGDSRDAERKEEPSRKELKRLAGVNWLVQARHGLFIASESDQYVGRSLIRYGEFSELEWTLLQHWCKSGYTVVDVGANIGAHTVTFAKAVGRPGRVIAIEPQPVIFQMLCANLALNGIVNTDVHQCGCGAVDGTMALPPIDYEVEGNFGGVSLEAPDQTDRLCTIPIRRIDDLLKSERRVDLIKIDVEGMENDVINGCGQIIDRYKPTLYVENDRTDNSQRLIERLEAMGYRMWWHVPPLFNPDNYYGNAEDLYPGVGSFNMLCIHRSRTAAVPAGLTEVTDSKWHPLASNAASCAP